MKFNVKIVIESYNKNTDAHEVVEEQSPWNEFDTLEAAKRFVDSIVHEF